MKGINKRVVSNRIHPFYVTNGHGEWVQAQHLWSGDLLLDNYERKVEVLGVEIKKSPLKAYNLTVEDFHTYFVKGSENTSANPVWVHNDCNDKAGRDKPVSLTQALSKYNKNDIHHLLGRGGAAPAKLLQRYGAPKAVLRELQKSAQAIANKSYVTNSWVTVKVGGIPVTIKGKVIDGIFRISSIAKKGKF